MKHKDVRHRRAATDERGLRAPAKIAGIKLCQAYAREYGKIFIPSHRHFLLFFVSVFPVSSVVKSRLSKFNSRFALDVELLGMRSEIEF
jgi:hypothetical protein